MFRCRLDTIIKIKVEQNERSCIYNESKRILKCTKEKTANKKWKIK